jgi:hypothetical protein
MSGHNPLVNLDSREFDLIGPDDQHFYRCVTSVSNGGKNQRISG